MKEISKLPYTSSIYDSTVYTTIKGNNNIANTGLILGNVTLNSSLDMRIVQMMLDTLKRNNELLQHLIALQSQKVE